MYPCAPDDLPANLREEDVLCDLARENERLRLRLLVLEQELRRGDSVSPPSDLYRTFTGLDHEKEAAERRVRRLEKDLAAMARKCAEIEAQVNSLANLHVAGQQLYATLDLAEVVEVLTEIIINLIGAEEFAIMLPNEKGGGFAALSYQGAPPAACGIFEEVARSGRVYVDPDPFTGSRSSPVVCIPLVVSERFVGIVALYRFLRQKTELSQLDYDLFDFLQRHAASAIFRARLHAVSGCPVALPSTRSEVAENA